MINGVHHVSFATTDIDRLLQFYCTLLEVPVPEVAEFVEGNEPFERVVGISNARGRAAIVRARNIHLEFFQFVTPSPKPVEQLPACDGGIRHVAFDVTDIGAEYARLREAGVQFLSEPQQLRDFGAASVYARDPDGNIVELQELFAGSLLEPAYLPPRA